MGFELSEFERKRWAFLFPSFVICTMAFSPLVQPLIHMQLGIRGSGDLSVSAFRDGMGWGRDS
jgi:hypothetical protein